MSFDQKSSQHWEVGVLSCHRQTDTQTERRTQQLMTESAQWTNSVKILVVCVTNDVQKSPTKSWWVQGSFFCCYFTPMTIRFLKIYHVYSCGECYAGKRVEMGSKLRVQ